jgi:methionyl-tRNA formyltransferase
MRLVFLGSGAFAVPSLQALLDAGHDVRALVCQPDREAGRGRALQAPPTKPVALARGLEVLQPRRVKSPETVAALRALAPELLVVVAYGQILSTAVLQAAPRGAVNVHGSLLPRWRGAAPIQWAVVAGDAQTGVTTMQLDEGLDTGPTLLARATPIGARETAGALHDRLARLGAELLLETLDGLDRGTLAARPQDDAQATHARLIEKEDGRLDWSQPADALDRRVRGFHPWPGTFALHAERTLKVLRAEPDAAAGAAAEPGTLLAIDGEALVVACGGGSRLRLLEVQPESRRPMSGRAFAAGARLDPGARLT